MTEIFLLMLPLLLSTLTPISALIIIWLLTREIRLLLRIFLWLLSILRMLLIILRLLLTILSLLLTILSLLLNILLTRRWWWRGLAPVLLLIRLLSKLYKVRIKYFFHIIRNLFYFFLFHFLLLLLFLLKSTSSLYSNAHRFF